MSAQDQRNDIIQEYIPELVRLLTGFADDDINMEHCVHFGWNIIRNHRNLSTNSHDVRRKIEGIQERFRAENCPEYADYLGRLCDEVVKHPLCVDHYEVDVHWSLLDFLFTLAYNPTGALRKNKNKIVIQPVASEEVKEQDEEKEYWKNVLQEDFIPVSSNFSSDSELSDWSEDNDDSLTATNNEATVAENLHLEDVKSLTSFNQSQLGELKPPEKSTPFRKFDATNAKEKLENLIQHSWWKTKRNEHCNAIIESKLQGANFAINYNKYLSETSNNLIRFTIPTTISEQHVMREILWMFHMPQNCSIFSINDNNQLKLKDNVTIPSCSVSSFDSYIQENFLPFINMMQILRNFHKSIYSCEDRVPPRTLECYAANLHLHLAPIWQDLLAYEKRLLEPQDFQINTLINMRLMLRDSMRHLEALYECHQQVVINWRQYPSHISAAFLLASLMHCYKVETDIEKANLFMSLLLASIKVFCEIIDTWWTEGRLDDWQQEYIVERVSNVDHTVCMREYCKNKSKAFFVPTHVSKMIEENSVFHLIQEHSLEAGRTLNLLYEINRIGDLRYNCDAMQGKLYNVFIEDLLKQINTLQSEVENVYRASANQEDMSEDSGYYNEAATNTPKPKENIILDNLTTQDDFLLMAFALNTSEEDLSVNKAFAIEEQQDLVANKSSEPINALNIYETLQKSKNYLPLEEAVINALTRILKVRIAFANCFVMRLYREEVMILKHLQNIRKVFLMEASDLMHQFYSKLFQQIESGVTWANPSILTMQLDGIICAKFPEMSSLFRLEINAEFRCETTKVVDCVEEIIVTYNLSRELAYIISNEDIQSYNKVFCFLLKVKWGITTLEKLQFARSHKRRIPYAKFEMIDLIMRRLEQLRFWMMYAIQSVHFHLMTHVLQSMGEQLDIKIDNCENLKEMEMVHKSYLSTVCEHCFLTESVHTIKTGVEQLLSLVSILRGEWLGCVKYIESNSPLAIDLDDSSDDYADTDFVTNSQIDAMEYTYICCHQYLANVLNDQVYLQKRTFLSGLRAAFNTSLPH
ncbi:gamma-tubulin complex component 5 [Lucilia sericata]|uniref:gamma-tubulin complex component 5 n=1 Tax=Lucilia sericata TaxID=13632 RepID=UPI0018A7FDCB|nr:gamma-tubulin complex component 5 [Lucilia sericata]